MTRLKRPPSLEDAGTMFVIAANYDVGEFRLAMRTVASRVTILDLPRRASPRGLVPLSSTPCVQEKETPGDPSSKLRMLIAAR